MNEELVSELGVEIPEEEVEEEVAVEKLYDLTKVEAAYCAM